MSGHTTTGRAVSLDASGGGEQSSAVRRLLLVASSADRWGYLPAVLIDVGAFLTVEPSCVLVVRPATRHGVELVAARRWRLLGGTVEHVDDPVGAVEGVDAVIVVVADLDAVPYAALTRAEELGVATRLHYSGRYPYPPGSDQAEGTHPAQIRARKVARDTKTVRRKVA